jgi:hypothetical protein
MANVAIRNQILDELLGKAQEALLPPWSVQEVEPGDDTAVGARILWLTNAGEDVVNRDSMTETKDLRIDAVIQFGHEDAGSGEGPVHHEADLVAQVEAALVGGARGVTYDDLQEDSWAPIVPQDGVTRSYGRVLVKFRARYRHNVGDPYHFTQVGS